MSKALNGINNNSYEYSGGGFPGGSVVKNSPDNAGNMGLIPDPGRSHMLKSS